MSGNPSGGDPQRQELLVVIITRGARTVAIAIEKVLDIMDDDPTRHTQIDDRVVVGSTVLGDRVTELIDVRQVVLRGDPSFFDDDGAQDTSARNAVDAALGAVGSEMASELATFIIAGAHYGVDLLRVQEALRGQARTPIPFAEPGVAGFINLRGQVVLTIDLRTRLGIEASPADLEPMMFVVRVDGEPISLLVDDVGDVIDVGGRRLEAPPDTLPTSLREVILGVYQLEDFLLLVLDIDRAIVAGGSLPSGTHHVTRRTP